MVSEPRGSPPDTQIRSQNPLFTGRHLFALVLSSSSRIRAFPSREDFRGKNECDGATDQHAIIPVLVEQQHPRLGGHGDGLLGGASVMGVEDGLAAVAGGGGVVSLFPMS